MSIGNVILGKLPSILLPLLCDGICDVFLLQQKVPRVGDVGQNNLDVGMRK